MPFRRFDWECQSCGFEHDSLFWVESQYNKDKGRWEAGTPAKRAQIECPLCKEETEHYRLLSAPLPYTYDKPYHAPVVGGKFDTEGYRKPPPMPTLPAGCEFDQARDILKSKEYQERKRENWDIIQQNKAKRARSKAMKEHPTMDIRNTPLPGDPSLKS